MNILKRFLILLFVFIFAGTTSAYSKTVQKEIQIQTKDSRIIKATISYINNPAKKRYPTVVLLHSLGYSSQYWGSLVPDLQNAGYAVIAVDLRGHGKSIYDGNFKQKTWPYFTVKTYQKIPKDVSLILAEAQKQSKQVDMGNMAMVGADIGANTAILVSKDLKKKPKTIVMISGTTNFKGLYIPIAMTDVPVPILSMASKKDSYSINQQRELAKFSQGGYYAKNYPQGGMGMLMLKVNPSMASDITSWIKRYLK